jgi:hypothetical protein
MANLFENIPDNLPAEYFTDLIKEKNIRIERIVSLATLHLNPGGITRGRMNGWLY